MEKVASEAQVVEFVRAAREAREPFEIIAGGTRREVGKPMGSLSRLDVSGLSGIVKYEPGELIVTARAATPLSEISAVLAQKGQRLGFDPADWSRLLGSNGIATLGGAASADASGSGRLRHGGPRDSLLAFRGVNGLGESFRGGAKVVKNVTGFDLPKLVCGAYGTLSVLTELTFRVYPKPQFAATLCIPDVTPEVGFAHLRKIAHSALEPSGLAYLPKFPGIPMPDVGQGAALIRLEGAAAPLQEKLALANGLLGNAPLLPVENELFADISSGALFKEVAGNIWRVFVAPADAPRVARELNAHHWLGDWAGGLIWLAAPVSDASRIRAIAAAAGGQAMLLRASTDARAALGLYAPQVPALADLSCAVRAAFDPLSLFNPGRLL